MGRHPLRGLREAAESGDGTRCQTPEGQDRERPDDLRQRDHDHGSLSFPFSLITPFETAVQCPEELETPPGLRQRVQLLLRALHQSQRHRHRQARGPHQGHP